jgi:2-polyprenyl-3-methyl-5-hydroxy-6-metoxy-1,4-benzoquinol methylase
LSNYGRSSLNVDEIRKISKNNIENKFKKLRNIFRPKVQGQYYSEEKRKILDYGSGSCQDLLEIELMGKNGTGVEIDSSAIKTSKLLGLEVLSSEVFFANRNETYEYVQLNQVIEHFPFPKEDLLKIVSKCDTDGNIFIATPNSDSIWRKLFGIKWINWHVPYHQHHFSKESLRILFKEIGLDIIFLKTRTPIEWSETQFYVMILWLFRKNSKNAWNSKLDHEKRNYRNKKTLLDKVIKFLRIVLRTNLTIVNLFFDRIGIGDCLVAKVKIGKSN